MLRKFVIAAVIAILFAGPTLTADKDKDKKKKGRKGPQLPGGKITKVEGDKITIAARKKGATTAKVYTITKDTKFVAHKGKQKKDLTADEAKGRLKPGTRVRVEAGADGKIKVLHLGSGKPAKKPKTPKDKK